MNYRDIVERFQKEKNGKCAIDDFISETRGSFIKKIVALNFFEEIHFGALPGDKLDECIDEFEEQLEVQFEEQRTRHQDVDILNLEIRLNRKAIMSAMRSILKPDSRFSTILRVEDISAMLSNYGKRRPYSKTNKTDENNVIRLSDKTHSEIISDFEHLLKENSSLMINKYYQILWVTDSETIAGNNDATNIRNLLGLYHPEGKSLVKITFDLNSGFIWHKPTFFHVIAGHHWQPSYRTDRWGITLNLENLEDGVIETVAVDNSGEFRINWTDTCNIQPLGVCEKMPYNCNDTGWEEYFNRRLSRIAGLCAYNETITNDLKFFLEKIK